MTRNNISEVAYNIQTVVDAKHNIPIDYKVTNNNDSRALSGMLRRTKTILGTNHFTALYDKGYHTGIEIKKAVELDINIMVAIPATSSNAPDENYNMDRFTYNELNDTYTCPQKQVLTTIGNWYQKSKDRNHYVVKHYKTNACPHCPSRQSCTKNLKGRVIERSEYAEYIEINKHNIEANPEVYKKRQSIAEHPYGTIKRQWGFYYIITKKGIKHASADAGFMFVAYNLRRLMNIIDRNMLTKFLQELAFSFFKKLVLPKRFIFKITYSFLEKCFDRIFLSGTLKLPLI